MELYFYSPCVFMEWCLVKHRITVGLLRYLLQTCAAELVKTALRVSSQITSEGGKSERRERGLFSVSFLSSLRENGRK
jgi:hypothetical protein